jgi:DNA-binding NarL/FixJ family response regulator
MKKISILLVDDHRLVREFWVAFLNADPLFEVIANTGYEDKAVEMAAQLGPDIVLLDINLTPYSGFEATKNQVGLPAFHYNRNIDVLTALLCQKTI